MVKVFLCACVFLCANVFCIILLLRNPKLMVINWLASALVGEGKKGKKANEKKDSEEVRHEMKH